jgi:hypothetical protein
MRKRAMTSAVLFPLLLGGCGSRPVDQSFVLVTIELPSMLRFDGFRLVKVVDGLSSPPVDRFVAGPSSAAHAVGVSVPSGGSVTLEVQAVYERTAVAEGSERIDSMSGQNTIVLRPCTTAVPLEDAAFVSCQDAVADAGAERVRTVQVAPADGGSEVPDAWAPPLVCLEPNPDAAPPSSSVLPSPLCAEYCAAMTARCPEVYGGDERCRYACEVLAWPPTGARDDTLECRTTWATAMPSNPADEANRCSFASPLSHDTCGEICAVYCRTGALICPDQFPPEQPCREACLRKRNELRPATLINYMQCRLDILANAIFQRDLCSRAAPNNRCGDCLSLFFDF